ncbi:MAG TPA: M20/M25/M40 family metallo-hydrolase [Spirochaetia bacterium]|nr:M20/M25/M40 family metallo-hydrolase [Spirochaetia bacterium]
MNTPQAVHDKLIPLLQEMIRNRCVNDGSLESGGETRSARTLQAFFADYGLEAELLGPHPSRQSLLLRIPGTDPMAPSLMLMGHTDVVPANADDWLVDPFSGELKDGYLWGRGALDMLNMTAAMAVAVAERSAELGPLPGDLLYLAVADEESSGRHGARWLVENDWARVKADYMVSELGGFNVKTDDGPAVTITLGEKGICWVRISVRGEPGHGSTPYMSSNAVVKIAEAIDRIASHKPGIVFTPLFAAMTRGLIRGGLRRFLATRKWGIDSVLRSLYRELPGEAKFLHTASRMTINPGVVRGGSKINVVADSAEAFLDIRIMPGETVEKVQDELRIALGSLADDVLIEFSEFFPSNTTELGTALEKATEKIVADLSPGTSVVPMFVGGVTDGRYWRQRGSRVIGFTLYDREMTLSRFAGMIHGINERVSVESLQRSLEYFYRLPEEFYRLNPST